ncbi:MAG: tol-pal system protein YbgF [Desulfovibrionaceae bacterium]
MKVVFSVVLCIGVLTNACSSSSHSKDSYYGRVRASGYPYSNQYSNNKSIWGGSDGDYAYNERRRQEEKERFLREEQERLRRVVSEKDTQIAELRRELMELREYLHKVLKEVSNNSTENDRWSIHGGTKVYQGSEYGEHNVGAFIYASTDAESVYPIELSSMDAGNGTTFIVSPITKEMEIKESEVFSEQKKEKKLNTDIRKEVVLDAEKDVLSTNKKAIRDTSISTFSKEKIPRGVPEKIKNEKKEYDKALQFVYAKKYKLARELFDSFIVEYPKSELIPNVLYWKGETYYGEENYIDAITTFKIAVNEHGKSNKAPDALLKMIMSYIALQDKNNAEFYRKILLEKYPKSLAAEKVKKLFF